MLSSKYGTSLSDTNPLEYPYWSEMSASVDFEILWLLLFGLYLERHSVKQLDFYTVAIEELESVTMRYKFRSMMRAPLHGFVFWFNVEFGWPAASPIITQASVIPTAPSSNPPMDGSKRKKRTNRNEAHVLSTAPEDLPTHWQHVLCLLVLAINVHSLLLIGWVHK
ncbi:hypothetical protein OIU84_015508 [Salix udensis]|uniref:Protein arginine N-methyltransferase domain-containing protein n=1 Tax=Salix udensis TaxID=889485 RepID=A0AAD6NPR9_9ROSI|nr:hypothetical protein OIU84_015508 [Salix udensis]